VQAQDRQERKGREEEKKNLPRCRARCSG